ncbi:hypothetical protein BLOT_013427 [Blomia tropicalis]|nr:hypothetical protein BLOT_013427 [Blomia tropicalis]
MFRYQTFLVIFTILCVRFQLIPANQTTFSLEEFNVDQLFESILLTNECVDSVVNEERRCFARHLDYFSGFRVKTSGRWVTYTEDYSSDFDRRVCCAIWRWYDCTSRSIKVNCTQKDWIEWANFAETPNTVTHYCTGYEHGTHYCWPLPLWPVIVGGIAILLLISCGIVSFIWNWKSIPSKNVSYHTRAIPNHYV